MALWENDYWLKDETDAEHADRVEAAKQEAGWYFERATAVQRARYFQTLIDIEPYRGAPKHERFEKAARNVWNRTTRDAQDLLVETCKEVMEHGEVSEAMSARWDALMAEQAQLEAA